MEIDPMITKIEQLLTQRCAITLPKLLQELDLPAVRSQQVRIGRILSELGWKRYRYMLNSNRVVCYFPPHITDVRTYAATHTPEA